MDANLDRGAPSLARLPAVNRRSSPGSLPSGPEGKTLATMDPPSTRTEAQLMLTLPPPSSYDLRVSSLTIGAPQATPVLPLPIPIPIPSFFLPKKAESEGRKTIVRDVSVKCASGEMLAIIGGSGSGKTTLLNAIIGRLANLPVLEGEIAFIPASPTSPVSPISPTFPNGTEGFTPRKMKGRIGFVRQNDYLLEHLTVRETLHYAAELRLPSTVSLQTRATIVQQTIEELGLKDAADTVVGGLLRKGISGGERRRLSIGCVLVTLPSVLVLDEPTTGLDAFTSFSLLLTLSQLARRNRTVILSLHQPRSDAFKLFDRLVLLSKGDVVYSGLTTRCLPWFSSLGMETPTEGVNPLDWLIDISSIDNTDVTNREESKRRVASLISAWVSKGGFWEGDGELEASKLLAKRTNDSHPEALEIVRDDAKRPGILKQTYVLTRRAQSNYYRNYGQMIGFGCQAIGIGILLGLTFFRLGETPSDIQSLKTISYQHIPSYYYLSLVYSIYRFCEYDLVVFDREREDHLYHVSPWILSEFIASFPLYAVSTGLFALILYFMSGMRTENLAANLFIFIAENITIQLGTVSFALLGASIQRSYPRASLLANGLQIFFLLTAGYSLLHPPVYVLWIRWLSVYFYGFRIATISQFKDRTFACPGVTGVARNQCDGNQVLAGLLIPTNKSVGLYFAGLIGLFIGFNALAGIILSVYHPGGVKHAVQQSSSSEDEDAKAPKSDMDISRATVDVEVRSLGFKWVRSSLGPFSPRIEKPILDNINVKFPLGKVTAIIGPSGAGKSSLLQLLASRPMNAGPFAHFETSGSILFNGQPLTKQMRSLVTFVEQEDDYHLPALTVRETLRYAAILRLPSSMKRQTKLRRAEEVLYMLGLTDCADTLVGGPLLKGISGGEKRRLSLAVQMIHDPPVLIVDEPTSGLDSLTAINVMTALNDIAKSGRTVIVSLHQPRSDIYQNTIDNLVVLVKGGLTAYSGPRNQVEQIMREAGHPIPPLFNPADFLLDLVSVDVRGAKEIETRERVQNLVQFWRGREPPLERDKSQYETIGESNLLVQTGKRESQITPFYIAFPVVLERMVKNLWRQQAIFWIRLQQAPFLGLLFWLFYQRLKHGPTGGQDRVGFVQQMTSPLPFVGLLNGVAIFPVDRDLYLHEYRSSAAYSPATFLCAFTLVELPLEILASILFTIIMNLGAGMQTSWRIFFEMSLVIFCLQATGESFGVIFATVTRSMGLSVSFVSTAITAMMQISGIFSVSIPRWLSILAWGTTFKYAARIIFINEAVGLHLNCTPQEIASGQCLAENGADLLALFGFHDLRVGRFAGIMVALTVAYRLLAWLTITVKVARMR